LNTTDDDDDDDGGEVGFRFKKSRSPWDVRMESFLDDVPLVTLPSLLHDSIKVAVYHDICSPRSSGADIYLADCGTGWMVRVLSKDACFSLIKDNDL
jgi:hypothetical protein